MPYEALARKYRPRTFEEVVGQKPIVRTLTNSIREKRIHHAYVFSGVRGVGKTTVARIFAKALNCEKGPTPTPCLRCDPCVEIAAGRNLDVIEMDAASRTGVDDVRDLIDTTRYAPARDRYKIFIIDEFHMLSKPAFNALLKTLEEPPPRVVFLMATTELHKVLPTVLSRTQQYDFRRVKAHEIADQLAMISGKESVTASRSTFEMIASAADGSVRDAESLLDQAIAFCGNSLEDAEVRALLGLVPEETVESFLSACADKDAGALIRLIDAALDEGYDLRIFHAGLIEGTRRLLILRAAENPSEILGLPADEETRLAALARRFSVESLLRIFSVLTALEAPLKYSDQPRYVLEAAAIRMTAISDLTPIEELIARLDEKASPGPGPRAGPAPGASGSGRGAAAARPARAPGSAAEPMPPGKTPPRRIRGDVPEGESWPARPGGAEDRRAVSPAGVDASDSLGKPSARRPDRTAGEPAADTMGSAIEADEPGELLTSPDGLPAAQDQGLHASEADTASDEEGAQGAIRRFLEKLHDDADEKRMRLSVLIERASSIVLEGRTLVLVFEDSQAFARKSVEQPEKLAILRAVAGETMPGEVSVEVRGQDARGVASVSAARGGASAARRAAAEEPAVEGSPAAALEAHPGSGTLSSPPSAVLSTGARDSRPPGTGRTPHLDSAARDAGRAEDGPRPVEGAHYQRLLAQALDDPVVKTVMQRFGGRIVDVKEVP